MTEENQKIYTPIDEVSFKVEETKHLESIVNVPEQLQNIANVLQQMKMLVGNAKQIKEKFYASVKWYNERVDIIAEGITKGNIPMHIPQKIEITEGIDLTQFDEESLPVIDIRRIGDEKKEEEKTE